MSSEKKLTAAANTHELMEQTAGRTIKGAFVHQSRMYLVFTDDTALGLTSFGGELAPCYWSATNEWRGALGVSMSHLSAIKGEAARLIAIEEAGNV